MGPVFSESMLHPHCEEERAHLFHSFTGGAGEQEVLQFLQSLVFLFKPSNLLETGTGGGYATIALAAGIRQNGFGHLHTIDIDGSWTSHAIEQMTRVDSSLCELVSFHVCPSLDWIHSYSGPRFDFVFFDSLLSFRHLEFKAMLDQGHLSDSALCIFHDTSRYRGKTMHDFNPEMIQSLDDLQVGKQHLESNLARGLRLIKLG